MTVLVFAVAMAATVLGFLRRLRRIRYRGQSYRFYDLRDRLLMLRAKGNLDGRDYLFVRLHHQLDVVCPRTHHLTFALLIDALRENDLARDDRLWADAEAADGDVRKLLRDYSRAVMETMTQNSAPFHAGMKIVGLLGALATQQVRAFLARRFRRYTEASQQYQAMKSIERRASQFA